jgi:hypothetical protein
MSTTSTTLSTSSTTTSSDCPAASNVVSAGGQTFYQFYKGNGMRNSFSFYRFTTFPASMSDADAIKNCAATIAGAMPPFAQTFQVFQYVPDGRWHCDGSLTTNTDSKFTPNSAVQNMYQYNALPSGCAVPTSIPIPPPPCPSSSVATVSSGNTKFYQLYKGNGVRNSYIYDTFTTFPASTSDSDAIQKCADYIKSRGSADASVFQVFFYNGDNTWHCDSSLTTNYDITFFPNPIVKQMYQYVAVPSNCASPTTTTSSPAATSTTPATSCPPVNSIITSGRSSFYQFFSGYAQRNNYKWSQYKSFPSYLSKDQATQKCADWIASNLGPNVAQTFQIFYYVDDCTWHCDASATINTNANFTPNNGVKQIAQYNPVPAGCPVRPVWSKRARLA